MQRVDINHDGVIQLTEFVAGLVDWKQLQSDSQWGAWVQVGGGGWVLHQWTVGGAQPAVLRVIVVCPPRALRPAAHMTSKPACLP